MASAALGPGILVEYEQPVKAVCPLVSFTAAFVPDHVLIYPIEFETVDQNVWFLYLRCPSNTKCSFTVNPWIERDSLMVHRMLEQPGPRGFFVKL